jgi:hypothetical protein
MAERFANTFNRDYVHIIRLENAKQVLEQLPRLFDDYTHIRA